MCEIRARIYINSGSVFYAFHADLCRDTPSRVTSLTGSGHVIGGL